VTTQPWAGRGDSGPIVSSGRPLLWLFAAGSSTARNGRGTKGKILAARQMRGEGKTPQEGEIGE